ncbi:EAL domain-containing protein [Phycicoccus duodecadis]|uniref:Diguanylate cyclase (GGDEF)-like protein n=1 Tax=Phycicoccus duodecadis TaxID=173053 RepID=A0A2N3YI85_9MICO|nr:EAL domain-containing protein [Phycicoccus duodecadis]PKW26551.1 diguanylate cyclase (GGDEF)-like protein [Phycicoccus duodecadis]
MDTRSALHLLLIQDGSATGERHLETLRHEFPNADVHVEGCLDDAMVHLGTHPVDMVLADQSTPGSNSALVLRAMRTTHPGTPLMVITDGGDGGPALWVLVEDSRGLERPAGSHRPVGVAVLRALQLRRVESEAERYLGLARGLLDASPDPTCAVDAESTIVAVNQAWRDFTAANGGTDTECGVGVSYLGACDGAAGDITDPDHLEATLMAQGLRHVLAGSLDHFRHDYACHSPSESRWFTGQFSPAAINGGRGAVISHHDITLAHTMEQSLAHQSLHDALTDLPNRDLMVDRVGQAISHSDRNGHRVAVTQIDLHHYHRVNDLVGYRGGDSVLVQVVERLQARLRTGDTLSSFTHNTFMVLWGELDPDGPETAVGLTGILLDCLDLPFAVGGIQVPVSGSAGVSVHTPGQTVDDLLRSADAALLDAKSRGPGQVVLFTEQLQGATMFRRSLETDLVVALSEPVQLVLHYQPVVELASGTVVAVEALVRWHHPQLGLLGPDRFVPFAEESGLIHQLGDWVLGQALRDAPRLVQDGRELDIAVNVSAIQMDDRVAASVHRALESSGVRPQRLVVELTESAIVEDVDATAATLRDLSRLGVKIAIDDFGTGYSSLLYLRRYPVDILKIDREFVSGIGTSADDEAICRSITGLAAGMEATTVGEGVETMDHYAFLRSLGCTHGQGFLWSPAVPIERFEAALTACDQVPVPAAGAPVARPRHALDTAVTALIARMHLERAPLHTVAAALNRTVGRHPTGVAWTAGAVARELPADEAPRGTQGLQRAPLALICTDLEPVRRLLRVDLEVAGFEVEETRDGHDAMSRLIESDAPAVDVIVVDSALASDDARWVIAAIRGHARLDDVPVLLVRSAAGGEPTGDLDDTAFDAVVTRPVEAAALVAAVQALARGGRTRHA